MDGITFFYEQNIIWKLRIQKNSFSNNFVIGHLFRWFIWRTYNWTFTIDKISLSYLFTFIFVLICRCDWITETFWTDGLRLGFFAFLYEKIFGRNWCCDHAGLSRLISSSVMELLLRWVKFRQLHCMAKNFRYSTNIS